MTDTNPAAGGLSDAEVEFVYDWTDPGKRREMAEELSHIIAARTEAADREVARVKAAVEAIHRCTPVLRDIGDCPDWESHEYGDADDGVPDCCWDCPPIGWVCGSCHDSSGESVEWPCATVAALSSADTVRRVRKPGPCWFRVAPAPCCRPHAPEGGGDRG